MANSAGPLLLCVAALTLAACGKQPAPQQAATTAATLPAEIGALEGAVDILVWPRHFARVPDDPRFTWITQFETDTGCKVTITAVPTADEIVPLMAQGGHDLAIAPGDASLRLIRSGLVQPINTLLVPNYNAIDIRLRRALWHYIDGVHYGVPFQWAPNWLMYDTRVFDTPPTSWSAVLEPQVWPDGKDNRGRVQAYGGAMQIADAALYLLYHQRDLGILNPYQLDDKQYTAALDLLRRQQPLVQGYWLDADGQVEAFRDAALAASVSWPYQVDRLAAVKRPVAGVIPQEGATGWVDTTMLSARARHPNCAYRWMEWSVNTRVQGDVAAAFGTVPVVTAACEGNEQLGPEGCKRHGAEDFERIWFWRTPENSCETALGRCVPYDRWVADYAVLVGPGQASSNATR
jgi:putative spermidine/putrescine transport system substrate-binding protein